MGNSIVYFEIPADDVARAQSFYKDLFGWEFQTVPGMDDYWTFATGVENGVAGGGLMARANPQHGITNYIGVDSVDEYAAKVVALGGKIVVPKQSAGGYGWMVWCADSEGNMFALYEEDSSAAQAA